MEIKLIQKEKDGKVVFKILKTSAIFANMIRREIMENVPTMAIESVEIRSNNSALYDEIISHRLGLIPLTTDLKSYTLPSKCKCEGEGCARCQLKLTLKVKGPCTVYASDIQSKDPKVIPVFPKTPIVKIIKGQEVEFEATAVLGQGKDHIKFASGLAYYHMDYDFKQSKKLDNVDEIVKSCPAGVFKAEDGKLVPLDETKGFLWDTCLPFTGDAVTITEKPEEIIFSLESWGQLSPKEILTQACDEFTEQLEEFETLFK